MVKIISNEKCYKKNKDKMLIDMKLNMSTLGSGLDKTKIRFRVNMSIFTDHILKIILQQTMLETELYKLWMLKKLNLMSLIS